MSENEIKQLTGESRQRLRNLSKSLLRLHKTLLDAERADYEAKNGKPASINEIFRLVLEDPNFAWLRVLSGQIVLIDEFLASKQPITETEGNGLIEQTHKLLNFEDENKDFGDKFQTALQNNQDAVINYKESLSFTKNK
jgi:hypothetical protein